MRFLKLVCLFLFFAVSSQAYAANPQLVCGSQKAGFRANFVVTMNRLLVAPYPKVSYEAAITGNQDGRPGVFDRIFTRAKADTSKERIRIESFEKTAQGDAVFVADIQSHNMTGYFYSADSSQGFTPVMPTDVTKNGIMIRCFWRSHPDCNCGLPGSSACSSGANGNSCR